MTPEVLVSPNTSRPDIARLAGIAALSAYAWLAGPDYLTQPTRYVSSGAPELMAWETPACLPMSDFMKRVLRPLFPAVRVHLHEGWYDEKAGTLKFHAYLSFSAGGPDFIADPTWRQFVSWQNRFLGADAEPVVLSPDAPLVLAGSRQEVIEQAQMYGLTEPRILELWREPDLFLSRCY